MDELIFAIQEAANTIAAPNCADIWGLIFSFATIVVAIVVAVMQYKILKIQTSILKEQTAISREQTAISKEQTSISREQTSISKEQTSITDRQNRIALFEKRLEIYDIILSCSVNVEKMKITDKNEDILKNLFILLTEDLLAYQKFNRKEVMLYLANCSTKLQNSVFLFPNKISSYLLDASKALLDLACIDIEADEIEGYNKEMQTYFEVIRCLKENNVLKTIQEETKMM